MDLMIKLSKNTLASFSTKTKGHILRESLVLFNDQGFDSVTTAVIAKRSDVLEGSLWYHFNSKKDIVSAHIDLFLDVFKSETKTFDETQAETIIDNFFNTYRILWDFRYLFRDIFTNSIKDDEKIIQKIIDVNKFLDDWVNAATLRAKDNGVLVMNEDDIEGVSEIILIIGRYWLDYSSKKYPEKDNEFYRKKGINLLIKALHPYLSGESKIIMSSIYKE